MSGAPWGGASKRARKAVPLTDRQRDLLREDLELLSRDRLYASFSKLVEARPEVYADARALLKKMVAAQKDEDEGSGSDS